MMYLSLTYMWPFPLDSWIELVTKQSLDAFADEGYCVDLRRLAQIYGLGIFF